MPLRSHNSRCGITLDIIKQRTMATMYGEFTLWDIFIRGLMHENARAVTRRRFVHGKAMI